MQCRGHPPSGIDNEEEQFMVKIAANGSIISPMMTRVDLVVGHAHVLRAADAIRPTHRLPLVISGSRRFMEKNFAAVSALLDISVAVDGHYKKSSGPLVQRARSCPVIPGVWYHRLKPSAARTFSGTFIEFPIAAKVRRIAAC